MADNDSFKNLKQNIIPLVQSSSDLEILKIHFKEEIASNRTLSKINTFSQLLAVLEDRDCLSENNVSFLFVIAEVLHMKKLTNLTRTYKKLQDLEDQSLCSKCSIAIAPRLVPVSKIACTDESGINNETQNLKNCDLQEAVENISKKIGYNWRVLLRELDIPEKCIDDIRKTYYNDPKQQAEQALKVWIKIRGTKATKTSLETALNSRLCKQKGLGSHLMLPSFKISAY